MQWINQLLSLELNVLVEAEAWLEKIGYALEGVFLAWLCILDLLSGCHGSPAH